MELLSNLWVISTLHMESYIPQLSFLGSKLPAGWLEVADACLVSPCSLGEGTSKAEGVSGEQPLKIGHSFQKNNFASPTGPFQKGS